MKKALLLSLFLLLNGCSFESILALGEVDKVEVVKKNPSVSHYRAYFTRSQLKPIRKNQKYLYFYNKKKKDLAILLHRYDNYYLYSLYHPKIQTKVMHGTSYYKIKKTLRKKGYTLSYPTLVGATSKVALRRYKGIKTLLVEVHDYSRLQAKYRQAIKTYDASKIKNLKTKLPHALIASYYDNYLQKAKETQQLEQLKLIAKQLNLNKKENIHSKETEAQIDKEVQDALAKEIPKPNKELAFNYYEKEASFTELDNYLNDKTTKDALSFNQYTQLKQRHAILNEAKILKEGSLEELISIYKINKDPKYKKRILQLMKKVQK